MNTLSPSVRLHLLGAPRLERDGATIAIVRRKAVALLAYLALTGQTHLRDSIATLLWPDSGQALGRANLRHTLVVLNQALGDHQLDIERDTLTLKQGATLWVDVLHFHALLAGCRSHGHAPDDVCAACLPLLLEAVALHAEQFLAGFSLADSPVFDDWQRSQQQQLIQALSEALDRLVRYFVQTGEYKRATEYAQRRLALDTLDEAAHRQLMQLYAWSGQQGLALRQFEQCTAILAKELDVSPSAETLRLMREIHDERTTAGEEQARTAAGHRQQPTFENVWRPAGTPRHNLPMRLPTLIGRDHDLRAIQEILQRTNVNLVTLIGPGGVGKTQLALHLSSMLLEDFADGVFFVSLAPIAEAEHVISALAQIWDLRPQENRTLLESVQSYLRHKRMLLIVDNFEHLMVAAPLVSELLANCAHLRMVVTSRELLNVQGEHLYAVSPLSLPKQGERLSMAAVAKASAVQLFVQRAQAITPGFVLDETNFVDIAEICTYLDGLPLAIELVSARIRLLPPRSLRQRLVGANASGFELLQGGARDAPLRHRSLRDAIAWSYDLLTAVEQRLLQLLSIFVGGCTFEAVERVSELAGVTDGGNVLELLASLVNKSLVQQVAQPDGESRYLLLEMIREYSLEHLQANDDFAVAHRAHAETYAAIAEIATRTLSGPDDLAWIARLNADHDNFQAALHWAITNEHAELALRISGALWSYWLECGYYREGRQFFSEILQLPGAASRTPDRARVLTGLGAISRAQGNMIEARTCLEEAVAICRELGDERGLAAALEKLVEGCFLDLGVPQVDQLCAETVDLYEKVNDRVSAMRMRQWLGFEKYHEGEYNAAKAVFEESLAIYKEQGHEAGVGVTLCNLGRVLFQQQQFGEAKQRFAEALSRAEARGDQPLVAQALYFLGRVAYYQAEYVQAQSLLEESLSISREIGARAAQIAWPLAFLSKIALARGDVPTAQSMLREGLTLAYQERDAYAIPIVLPFCASLATTLGKYTSAVQVVAAGRSLYQSLGVYLPPNDQVAFDAPLAAARPLLSPELYAQAWAVGERMTMAEAVTLALREITGGPSTDVVQQVSEDAHPWPDVLRASSADRL